MTDQRGKWPCSKSATHLSQNILLGGAPPAPGPYPQVRFCVRNFKSFQWVTPLDFCGDPVGKGDLPHPPTTRLSLCCDPVFSEKGAALSQPRSDFVSKIEERFPRMTLLDPLATRREGTTSHIYPLDPVLSVFSGKGAAQPSPQVIFCIYNCTEFLTDDTLDLMVTRQEEATPSSVHLTTYFDDGCRPLPAFSTQGVVYNCSC